MRSTTLPKSLFNRIFCLLAILSTFSLAEIADIQSNNGWYYLYNENGARYKTVSMASVGEIVGYCESYFVSKNNGWYYFFDDKGNRFMTKNEKDIGTIKHVSNSGFTSLNGAWIYSWNKKGQRTGTKSAKKSDPPAKPVVLHIRA